tara:strand:- start:567 stop:1097 length:531 start_codon:yes stop_codon:yes gene_type:complete
MGLAGRGISYPSLLFNHYSTKEPAVNIRLNDHTVTALTAAYDEFQRDIVAQVVQEVSPDVDYCELSEHIDVHDLADALNVEASDLAECFPAREIAGQMDCACVAEELCTETIAGWIPISDVAEQLDLETIAEKAYDMVDTLLLTSAVHDMVMDSIRMNKWYRRLFRKVKKIVKRNR